MEGFNEQVVKRKNGTKQMVIKIIAVLILILVPFIAAALAIATKIQYIMIVGGFVFLGGIYVVWYVFSCQKVEFEYSVAGNDLDISKVIALRKRKKMCRVPINEITELTKDEEKINKVKVFKTYMAARDENSHGENYYAVFNDPAYGKCLLVFNPNEQILEGMKPKLEKSLMLKVFYNKTV